MTPELAELLADLDPDGEWPPHLPRWRRYSGSVWRLLVAVGLGADPEDPRLQRSAARLLAELDDDGVFDPAFPSPPAPCVVARVLEALSLLGLGRDLRFQQGLAWLEEGGRGPSSRGAWVCPHPAHRVAGACAVTAVATASALHHSAENRRVLLRGRAHAGVLAAVARGAVRPSLQRWGHPNLLRTDLVEMLHVLAMIDAPYQPEMRAALLAVQRGQDGGAWWRLRHPSPRLLTSSTAAVPGVGERSPWLTLRASVALLRYAPDAALPRRFPEKP